MGAADFWGDQATAARVSTEHSRATRKLERYERLQREFEDAKELYGLDPELEGEVAEQLRPSRPISPGSRRKRSSRASTTGATPSSRSMQGPAAPTRRTGPRCCSACTSAGRPTGGSRRRSLEASAGEEAGLKSTTVAVRGENAYGVLKAERGVHRLVRLSPFDASHRRHTAFAQVVVAPLLPDDIEVEIDEGDLRIDTYRATGAGGQHVNKTDSAVRITHLPTGTVVQCQNERSQTSNKQTALRILRSRLAELEEEKREAELAKERGVAQDIGFGSQIRSYVLHPYQLVKDHPPTTRPATHSPCSTARSTGSSTPTSSPRPRGRSL